MARPSSATDGSGQLLADRAYIELRDRIVKLQIEPGAPIDEDSLAQQLAMGRTPVREAIKRLVLENLVVVFPRRGTFAAEINITDLTHISDVRGQLEGHAAYLAAQRLTEPQLAELQQLRADLALSQGSEGVDALMELDARVPATPTSKPPWTATSISRDGSGTWCSTGFRICSQGSTSTTRCSLRSPTATPSAPSPCLPSTSQPSSVRSARSSDRRSVPATGRDHNRL